MIKIFWLVFILSSFLASAQTDSLFNFEDFGPLGQRAKAAVGKSFGDFSTTSDPGITPQSFKDKIVFINFWFEACAPCITEMDGLNALYMQTKDSANFMFVSFTYESDEKIQALKKKYGLQYPVYHLKHEDCIRLNQGLGFPTNILIDKTGRINHLTFGALNDKKKMEALLRSEFYWKILASLKSL